MTKRLFIFAAFDPRHLGAEKRLGNLPGEIDDSLILYLSALSKIGDIVFCMDNDIDNAGLAQIKPYVLYAGAARHHEYDFGSYKRGYAVAHDKKILQNYDRLYMVNDSVYGPLRDLQPILEKWERSSTDAFGMMYREHRARPHLQSWFIGMAPSVFLSKRFDEFIMSVAKQPDKGRITYLYEQGFTRLLNEHKLSYEYAFKTRKRGVYNRVRHFFNLGMPFMKKVAFTRRGGALGGQISYVLNRIDPKMKIAIIDNARYEFGDKYIDYVLTNNIFKIAARNIKYFVRKIFKGGI